MVRLSLTKLDDVELVSQIEDKVGNDLQFIRLNGAVVGGLVGVFIATLRLML
ncbi:putative membrane protein [Saccharicrinis fermentans DSM 9555 = JCM 21142]|uniref:Putative membrane protein n=2 Tax=Saccharicrinis fermentans TaxID=982 RepID=W7Y0F6_9BACT|nr:putative membrane protein [Saccharicrinis fermentans DSM 9555 = JCM 21142]